MSLYETAFEQSKRDNPEFKEVADRLYHNTWKENLDIIDGLEGREELSDEHNPTIVYIEAVYQTYNDEKKKREEQAKTVQRAINRVNVGRFN